VLASGAASQSATISAVTMAETLLFYSYTSDEATPGEYSITGQLTSTTNIDFVRFTSTGANAITIHYTLVMGPELTVQRGTHSAAGTDPTNVTISAVTLANAFCVVNSRVPGSNMNADDFIAGELTSTTNLALRCTSPNADGEIVWQVAEHSACSVQRGTIALASTVGSNTATVSSVDMDKSWLVCHATSDSSATAAIGEKLAWVVKTNGTTLTATRQATTAAMTMYYQLITMTDGSEVQEIEVVFGTGDTDVDDPISAVDLDKTLALAAGSWNNCSGSTSYASNDTIGVAVASLNMDSTTNLNSIRGLTGSLDATLLVNVVEFNDTASGGGLVSPLAGEGGLAGAGGLAGRRGGLAA
jgi:hypothetical protein